MSTEVTQTAAPASASTTDKRDSKAIIVQKDKLISNISALAGKLNDKLFIDKIRKELAKPISAVNSKSKYNRSQTLEDALFNGIDHDIITVTERASLWAFLIDHIKFLRPYINMEEIEPLANNLGAINKMNSEGSHQLRLKTAMSLRKILMDGAKKTDDVYKKVKGLAMREEIREESNKYKAKVDKRGHYNVPIDKITSAIRKLYTMSKDAEKYPDTHQKKLYLALQMASGLRKPELLNADTGKIEEYGNEKIKKNHKDEIVITGVAKKSDEKNASVNITRPLIELTFEEFMQGLTKLRKMVKIDKTKSKKAQNEEIETLKSFDGMVPLIKEFFADEIDQIKADDDSYGIKNLPRQLWAGAAYYLHNPDDDDRSKYLKKMFAHDSAETTLSYELIRAVPKGGIQKGAGDFRNMDRAQIEKFLEVLKQSLLSNGQPAANTRNPALSDSDNDSDSGDDDDLRSTNVNEKYEDFIRAYKYLKKNGEKTSVRKICDRMGYFNKDAVSKWINAIKSD